MSELGVRPVTTFEFTVEHVFHIEPLSRLILVGMVDRGSVYPGDSALVKTSSGDIFITVEAIEGYKVGELPHADAGQQVGLRLADTAARFQIASGDKVRGKLRP